MIRVALRTGLRTLQFNQTPRFSISNWKIPSSSLDASGITGFFESSNTPHMSFMEKISQFSPKSLYYGFDEWTRQFLVTLSSDLNLGLGVSIVIATIALRLIFLYPTMRAQFQGLRHVEQKQIMATYMEKMKISQQTGNKSIRKQADYERKLAMKKKGFNNFIPMLNLFQIPVLITWFLSIRYMSNLPEIYPQIYTQGFLWFQDLSTYDPYFILPVAAACLSSLAVIYSPNLARNNISMPFMVPFVKYLKFLPFGSLLVTAFFPSSLCLYWTTLAAFQLATTQMMRIKTFKNIFSGQRPMQKKKQIIDIAVFQEQKKTSEQIMNESTQKMSSVKTAKFQPQDNVKVINILKTRPKKKKVDQ